MIRTDLHIHTNFSDGNDSPRAMVLAALDRGLETIGFADHSYTEFDVSYCMRAERIEEYVSTVAALREEFRGSIEILCGVEQDLDSTFGTEPFEYAVGSVHYLALGDEHVAVDWKPEILLDAAERYFGGDFYALIECYYSRVASLPEAQEFDSIGHFDLIGKFNEGGRLFDPDHPRCRAAWQAAADRLLRTGKPFEINTGAIARGYRSEPYPSREMIDYIRARGGRLLLSSDSHSTDTLAFEFDKWEHLLF